MNKLNWALLGKARGSPRNSLFASYAMKCRCVQSKAISVLLNCLFHLQCITPWEIFYIYSFSEYEKGLFILNIKHWRLTFMQNDLTAIGWRGVKYELMCIIGRPTGCVCMLTMGLFAAGDSGGELELACAISQSTGHVVFPANSLLRRVRQLTYNAPHRSRKVVPRQSNITSCWQAYAEHRLILPAALYHNY